MRELLYSINPDRNVPWNDIPSLPIRKELYQTTEILEKLGDAKAALARLHGRSAIIPNQGLLINTISLQEAKISSAIENIFTTDDEQYRIDHLLKMAITHFQFEAIHPFRDGNGRLGCILNIHYLTNKGLLDVPILFLSRYILDH